MEDTFIYYCNHFIRVDEENRIAYGFSDAFEQPQDGDILHNDKGGRHFQLCFADGSFSAENPQLRNEWGVLLYKLAGEFAEPRAPEDIEADMPEPPEAPEAGGALSDGELGFLRGMIAGAGGLND